MTAVEFVEFVTQTFISLQADQMLLVGFGYLIFFFILYFIVRIFFICLRKIFKFLYFKIKNRK